MKQNIFTICLFLVFSSSVNSQVAENHGLPKLDTSIITVQTSLGLLKGIKEDGVNIFKGIPYAAAPIGENRWRPPQPFPAWKGERDATKFGPACAQPGFPRSGNTLLSNSSEDCLFLNIWQPPVIDKAAKLPVMVWIHGGGFVGGSGSGFSGVEFAKKGVLLVTINYRLGRLGFFAFPALSNEKKDKLKGNYGYMDQIAALKWIKQNISSFGGDPGNITVFGESAGGVSVHSLITSPLAKGLFQKAISESGGGRDGVLTGRPLSRDGADVNYPVSAETIGVNFARRKGINTSDETALKMLRALPVEEIVDGGQETNGPGGAATYSGPILDGRLIAETAQQAYDAGRGMRIPLIIGSNSADFVGFVNADSKEALFSQFGPGIERAKKAYDPEGTLPLSALINKVGTDRVQAEPARFIAAIFAKAKVPAFVYRFSYVPVARKNQLVNGAPHGFEIPYVFNTLRSRSAGEIPKIDQSVAELVHQYWVNFAKNGDPNDNKLRHWPKFENLEQQIIEFTPEGGILTGMDRFKDRLDVTEQATKSKKH